MLKNVERGKGKWQKKKESSDYQTLILYRWVVVVLVCRVCLV